MAPYSKNGLKLKLIGCSLALGSPREGVVWRYACVMVQDPSM